MHAACMGSGPNGRPRTVLTPQWEAAHRSRPTRRLRLSTPGDEAKAAGADRAARARRSAAERQRQHSAAARVSRQGGGRVLGAHDQVFVLEVQVAAVRFCDFYYYNARV